MFIQEVSMHVVVIFGWKEETPELVRSLADALGVTVFEARQRIIGGGPAVVASFPIRDRPGILNLSWPKREFRRWFLTQQQPAAVRAVSLSADSSSKTRRCVSKRETGGLLRFHTVR